MVKHCGALRPQVSCLISFALRLSGLFKTVLNLPSPVFSLPQPGFWIATLGLHSQNLINDSHVQISKISKVVYHPWYKGYENDIALMKLEQPVQLNSHVRPICLPNADLVNNLQDLHCVR